MTVKQAMEYCRANGIRLERRDGEYRVTLSSWINGLLTTEEAAYYTDDLQDAISTGLIIAAN